MIDKFQVAKAHPIRLLACARLADTYGEGAVGHLAKDGVEIAVRLEGIAASV